MDKSPKKGGPGLDAVLAVVAAAIATLLLTCAGLFIMIDVPSLQTPRARSAMAASVEPSRAAPSGAVTQAPAPPAADVQQSDMSAADVQQSDVSAADAQRPAEDQPDAPAPAQAAASNDAASSSGTAAQAAPAAVTAPAQSAPEPAAAPASSGNNASGGSGNANNFNLYNNPEQHNTTAKYVLNKSTMKVHYPECPSVESIKPANYSTSDDDMATLKSKGYAPCGRCNPV